MKEIIMPILEGEKDELISLRRELHKNPELSKEEYKTAEFIENYLKKAGYTPKRVNKTGVIAYLDCGKGDATLLRADIDALPVDEKNNVDYKSQNPGVMHACGHDAHMAMLLLTAKILQEHKSRLKTNVLFVFQPDEEVDGGAEFIINSGILKQYNVTNALGYHVMNDITVGKVMIKPGALMAAPDDFSIKIIGTGGHGSMPDACIDPISIATRIVTRLNDITNQVIKNGEKQVVQVCKICGGTSSNVIPGECEITGTARNFNEEVRRKIPEMIENVIKEETGKKGALYNFSFNYSYPPLINNTELAEKVKGLLEKNIPDVVITKDKPYMLGEDFAYFAKEVPSLFMILGTGNEEKGITQPLHSDVFTIDEEGLTLGVAIYLAVLFL